MEQVYTALAAGWRRFTTNTHVALWLVAMALLVIIAAIMGVAELSDDVMEGDTQAIDAMLMQLLRVEGDLAQPLGPRWLQFAAADITALGGYAVLSLICILAAGYTALVRRWDIFVFLLFSTLGALVLNNGLKALLSRERPDVLGHLVEVSSYSYPSGHALMSSAIYLSFAAVFAELAAQPRARVFIVLAGLLVAGLVGITRVYLGVHYPTDVLAGWSIGSAWAIFCWLAVVFAKSMRSGAREITPAPR